MSPTETKEHAHVLIDLVAPTQLPVVVELLEKMVDPVALSLANAPFEDEEISEAEEVAAAQARAEGYRGSVTSHEDLLKEFGLTPEEFERMGQEPLDEEEIAG
jgi:hypothetical protein